MKCEFFGMSLITAVTLYGFFSISIDLPTASVVLKYFFAADSLITTVLGSSSAVFVSPVMAGNVNTLNNVESA